MKLRYLAKTTEDGYSFVFRNVLEFKFMAAARFLSVQLDGKRLELHGVTSFEGGGDHEPHKADFTMIPPFSGGEEGEASGDGLSIVLASRTATFDGVEVNVSENSTKDILELMAKSREVYADGRLVKSVRAHSDFEFPREAPVPVELSGRFVSNLDYRPQPSSGDSHGIPLDTVMTTFAPMDRFSDGGVVGKTGKIPPILNTEYVFTDIIGARDYSIDRIEKAIKESNLRFRSAAISNMKESRKMGLVH